MILLYTGWNPLETSQVVRDLNIKIKMYTIWNAMDHETSFKILRPRSIPTVAVLCC